MNQQGQTVSQSALQASNKLMKLDIDKLEAGTYFIRVKNQQSIAYGKFIKTD